MIFFQKIFRTSYPLSALAVVLTFSVAGPAKGVCLDVQEEFAIAKILKEAMGMRDGFATDFRQERKSTNSWQDSANFKNFILGGIRFLNGEKPPYLRDVASEGMTNVTNTIYPFSREIQSQLNARIRIRQYGERAEGSEGLFTPTMKEASGRQIVGLEIKAKTEIPGVVVKPIVRVPAEFLPLLFANRATLVAARDRLITELSGMNRNLEPNVIASVLNVVETFHQRNEALGNTRVEAVAIEYERQAYVSEVRDTSGSGKTYKIQMTFDRAISMRDKVDPMRSPRENAEASPITYKYPNTSRDGLMVTEMKTPVELMEIMQRSPEYVRNALPSFYMMNGRYEMLQRNQAPGFNADSGKAKQIATQGLKVGSAEDALLLEAMGPQ